MLDLFNVKIPLLRWSMKRILLECINVHRSVETFVLGSKG